MVENGNGVRIMRKAIVWFIAGFIAATAFSAHAEEMKNKIVQDVLAVFINNEQVADAILVDNMAYVPLREVGEKAGYKVAFGEDRVIRMDDNRVKMPFETSAEVNKFNELSIQQKDITIQIADLGQILAPYEILTVTNEGPKTKAKDDLYYTTKQKRDSLITQRNMIDQQIKEVSEQIKEYKKPQTK